MPQAQAAPNQPVGQVHLLPTQQRAATLEPGTWNEQDRTIEVIWTTGARRRAYDYYSDTLYEEELAVTADAADMSRFEAGVVQVLDSHRVYGGLNAILGIAQRGWITPQGEGRALLRLSDRPEIAGLVGDIKAGIIRSISFGYTVSRYEITRSQDRTDGVNLPLYRAVAWCPSEISFVTIPADAGAHSRSQNGTPGAAPQVSPAPHTPAQGGLPCEFTPTRAAARTPQEPFMPQAQAGGAQNATPNEPAAQAARSAEPAAQAQNQAPALSQAEAVAQALARSAQIVELCTRSGVPHLAAQLLRDGKTVEQAGLVILDEKARADAGAGGHVNASRIGNGNQDEFATRVAGMQEALQARVDPRHKLTDAGRQFRSLTLLELGRDMLEAGGVQTRGMDKLTLVTRMLRFRSTAMDQFQQRDAGLMSTSDFSYLLANVANKRLRQGYDENPGTYARWARKAPNLPDFKSLTVAQMSAMPDLLKVNEHGEFTLGAVKDGGETYALLTYGRIVGLTRQAIINDDLRAFDRLVNGFGASAARLENRLVYAQLTANAALGNDSVALFHATHANLGTGAGSALQFSALTAGRTAMRVQKGLQSEELNITPSFLIVPAALEQTAYQLTSSNYVPAQQSNVNEFRTGGRTALEPVVEPVLDANSAAAWYMAASNSQVDTVEYAWLDGAEGPIIETEMGFEVDGLQMKCREDFAAKALDYRGLYKANGA